MRFEKRFILIIIAATLAALCAIFLLSDVEESDATDVTLYTSANSVTVNVGQTGYVTLYLTETNNDTGYASFFYDLQGSSSDTSIMTASDPGGISNSTQYNLVVTGVSAGTATASYTVTYAVYSTRFEAYMPQTATVSFSVTVTANPTSVTLDQSTMTITTGFTKQLTATVLPHNATDRTVAWSSSNSAVASVSSTGLVTGESAGSATITVTTNTGGLTDTCVVTVVDRVVNLSISPQSLSVAVGQTGTITTTLTETGNYTSYPSYIYTISTSSSNTSVMTISNPGSIGNVTSYNMTVSAIAGGTANASIGVTYAQYSARFEAYIPVTETFTVPVTVTSTVTGVTLNKTTTTLTVGYTEMLTATVTPNDAPDQTVSWSSSNTGIADVDSNGVVTGVSAGTAVITVTTNVGNLTDTCTVTVVNHTVTISAASTATVDVGSTYSLAITLTESGADPNHPSSMYNITASSSNNNVMTITSPGSITSTTSYNLTISGIAAGSATATMDVIYSKYSPSLNNYQSYTVTLTTTVTVTAVAVTGITLSPQSLSVATDSTAAITATVYPSNATNKAINWTSSNTSVATVNSSGVVSGLSTGSTTITATTVDGGYTATVSVTVVEHAVNVTVSPSTLSVNPNDTGTLTLTLTESGNLTGNPSYMYDISTSSSSASIMTLTNPGSIANSTTYALTVTGVSSGTATANITVVYAKYSDRLNTYIPVTVNLTATVNVTGTAVTGVTVSPSSFNLTVGFTQTLTATVSPSNATNQAVTWASDDTSVASVDGNGVVTGVAPGTASITVTTSDGGFTATSTVTVSDISIVIALSETTITLNEGSSTTIVATLTETGNYSQYSSYMYDITGSSSDPSVMTVSNPGSIANSTSYNLTITGVSSGQATASFVITYAKYSPVLEAYAPYTETLTVSVTVNAVIPWVIDVEISPTSATVDAGSSQSLTITLTESGNTTGYPSLIYNIAGSSSNTSVMTTSDPGNITAATSYNVSVTGVSAGSAIATFVVTYQKYSERLSTYEPISVTLTASVTVNPVNEWVINVELDSTTVMVNAGDVETVTIILTEVNNTTGHPSYMYNIAGSSSDTDVATVDNPGSIVNTTSYELQITGLASGTATATFVVTYAKYSTTLQTYQPITVTLTADVTVYGSVDWDITVSLSQSSVSVQARDSVSITVNLNEANNPTGYLSQIFYISTTPSSPIITVDDPGRISSTTSYSILVTGNTPGTATVDLEVVYSKYSERLGTYIPITENLTLEVTVLGVGIVISDYSVSMDPGETVTLTITLVETENTTGRPSTIFRIDGISSDPSVATVSNPGQLTRATTYDVTITGVSVGTATASFDVSYGVYSQRLDAFLPYTQTITVDVSVNGISVTLDRTFIFIQFGGSGTVSVNLTEVGGSDGNPSYIYNISTMTSPTGVASISNPGSISGNTSYNLTVTAISGGTAAATITVTYAVYSERLETYQPVTVTLTLQILVMYEVWWDNGYINGSVEMAFSFGTTFDNYSHGMQIPLLIYDGTVGDADGIDEFSDSGYFLEIEVSYYRAQTEVSLYNDTGLLRTRTVSFGQWPQFSVMIDAQNSIVTFKGLGKILNEDFSFVDYQEYSSTEAFNYSDIVADLAVQRIYHADIDNSNADSHPRFQVVATTTYLDTYGFVMVDPSINIHDQFPNYDNIRLNLYSFAIYGDSFTINGHTFNMDGSVVSDLYYVKVRETIRNSLGSVVGFDEYNQISSEGVEGAVKYSSTLQNIYITWENVNSQTESDRVVNLTFVDNNFTVRMGNFDLGNLEISFDGVWYFTTAVWEPYMATETSYSMNWNSWFNLSADGFIILFIIIAISCIVLFTRYMGWNMEFYDWLVVIGAGIIAYMLLGVFT